MVDGIVELNYVSLMFKRIRNENRRRLNSDQSLRQRRFAVPRMSINQERFAGAYGRAELGQNLFLNNKVFVRLLYLLWTQPVWFALLLFDDRRVLIKRNRRGADVLVVAQVLPDQIPPGLRQGEDAGYWAIAQCILHTDNLPVFESVQNSTDNAELQADLRGNFAAGKFAVEM